MSIQEIGTNGKESIQGYPNKGKQKRARGFQESLLQNLKCQEKENTSSESEKPGKEAVGSDTAGKGVRESVAGIRINGSEDRANAGVTGKVARLRVNELMDREAVQSAEVRHMSYEESDNIEIAVTEGYTLKGKMEGRRVYVEAKYEDGRLEAYHVDTDKVQEQTQHRIEQFALETADSVKA